MIGVYASFKLSHQDTHPLDPADRDLSCQGVCGFLLQPAVSSPPCPSGSERSFRAFLLLGCAGKSSLQCSKSSAVPAAVPVSPAMSSKLDSTCRKLLMVSVSHLLTTCRQCAQPCCALQRSYSWAELSVCRHGLLSFAPLGSLEMSAGRLGRLLGNRMKESHVFPPSAGERDCFPTASGLASLT